MITELLDATIDEMYNNPSWELTEFQLGSEPMAMFIVECKSNMGIPISAEISKITKYKDFRIREHETKDAIMYSIQLKKKA